MSWKLKAHLEPAAGDNDHATLCNVKARRWEGKKLVKTEVRLVSEHAFDKLPLAEQCGRCFIKLCAREGVPMIRP